MPVVGAGRLEFAMPARRRSSSYGRIGQDRCFSQVGAWLARDGEIERLERDVEAAFRTSDDCVEMGGAPGAELKVQIELARSVT